MHLVKIKFMKRNLLFLLFAVVCTSAYTVTASINESLQKKDPKLSEGCSWMRVDCPGIWTGEFEACLKGGDGKGCPCGEVTRECPKD